jgi:cytochrome subunit of sulfide dehydrogenase
MASADARSHNPPPVFNKESPMSRTIGLAPATLALLLAAAPWAPAHAQDAHLARNLAATCANCHGTNGTARGDMKPLAGVPAATIVAMLADYKSGSLPATVMHQIARGYTDGQIKLIADYLAAQQPKK